MRLSKIYSNDCRFPMIEFRSGINALIATGEKPHSVGKTTFLEIIDYCLLRKRKSNFLQLKNFSDFEFFLEIQKSQGGYITIKRIVKSNRIALKVHERSESCLDLSNNEFDYYGNYEEMLKQFEQELDFYLNGRSIGNFRQYVHYFLREKEEHANAFKPNSLSFIGEYAWKSLVASMVGMDGSIIAEKGIVEDKKTNAQHNMRVYREDFNVESLKREKIGGEIFQKEQQIQEIEKNCKELRFEDEEKRVQNTLVDNLDAKIAKLNKERYFLLSKKRLIKQSLKKYKDIDLKKIQSLYEEVYIDLSPRILKSFEDVIAFNEKITKDSIFYLKKEEKQICKQLEKIEEELKTYNKQRDYYINTLEQERLFDKFFQSTKEVSEIKLQIQDLENKMVLLEKYEERGKEIDECNAQIKELNSMLSKELKSNKSKKFEFLFRDYSEKVFGEQGEILFRLNQQKNLEIRSGLGQNNTRTHGETLGRLQCFVFNMCSILLHKHENFFDFVVYDGLFDNLADEYQNRLIQTMMELGEQGVQIIFTSTQDSIRNEEFKEKCKQEYLLREISDSEDQRLFRMPHF